MTDLQWLIMGTALKKLEEQEHKKSERQLEAFRQIMIGLLGLRLNGFRNPDGTKKDIKDVTEEDLKQFTPLVFFVGHPEILKTMAEEAKKEDDASLALQDAKFEELSAKMAENSDMEPVSQPIMSIDDLAKQSVAWKQMESMLVVKSEPPKFEGDPGPNRKIRFFNQE